jgi:hypothetical protein
MLQFSPGNHGSKASYYVLEKLYEHDLGLEGKHFTAYNMTHGPFGGVRGRDMILVQVTVYRSYQFKFHIFIIILHLKVDGWKNSNI